MSPGADQRRERAEQLLSKGAYSEALIELRNADESAPEDPRLLLLIAKTSLKLGDLEAASKALDEAVAANAAAEDVARTRVDLMLAKKDFNGLLAFVSDAKSLAVSEAQASRAQALVGLDRCTEAIPLARAAVVSDPDMAAAKLVLSQCYAGNGDSARALRELEPGSTSDPAILVARGQLERMAGKPTLAAATWDRAAKFAGGELDVGQLAQLLSSIADLQIVRNDLEGLRETHRRMLGLAPDAKLTVLLGARLQLREARTDAAVNTLRKLATDSPDLAAVHSTLASAYIRQRSWEQARREAAWIDRKFTADKAPQLEKQIGDLSSMAIDTEKYWLKAAGVHLDLGQIDAVHEALQKAQTVAPESFPVQLAQARLELQIGNVERALALSSALVKSNPQDAPVQLLHADALLAAERFAEASGTFDSLMSKQPSAALAIAAHRVRKRGALAEPNAPLVAWLSRSPDDLPVRAEYAEALRQAGENSGAIVEYERLVGAAPGSVPALNNLAWLYYLAGDKRALETARRAWQLAPKQPAVQDTYGWLLVENGSVEEGIAILEQADRRIGLTQPEVRVHYVVALQRHGKSDVARSLLRELRAEKPEFASDSKEARLLATVGSLDAT